MGDCNRRSVFADRFGCGVRVERFPRSAGKAIWLEHFGDNLNIYDQHFCPGLCCIFRWPVAKPQRTARGRIDRWCALWVGNFSRQLHSSTVVALPDIWRGRRNWPWPCLHRSSGRACEVVSRSPRTHYRDCGWRVRRRRAYYGAGSYATHSERRCPEYVRLSWDRISDRHGCHWIVYAESARWLEACGLDADTEPNVASRRP